MANGSRQEWRRAALHALPIAVFVLGLYGYWFGIADRYAVFLYEHLGATPFDAVTRSRYWMAGLVAAVCNGPIWLQVTLFFVVSIVALAATRPLVTKLMKKDIKPTNADRVLGGSARVTERIDNDVPTGAVYIDGKTWSARSSTGEIIEPDAMVRVIRMEGVKLYVEKEA